MKLKVWIDPRDGSFNLLDEDDNWFAQTSRPSGYVDGGEFERAQLIAMVLSE